MFLSVTWFDQGSAGDFLLVSLDFCFVLFSRGVLHVSAFTWGAWLHLELPSCSFILCINLLWLPEQDTIDRVA